MDNKEKHNEDRLYGEAKKRLKIKSEFIIHRNIYIAFMFAFTIMMGAIGTYSNEFWECMLAVLIVGVAWGFGVVTHFIVASRNLRLNDYNKIEKEMEFIRNRRGEIPEKGYGEPYKEKYGEKHRKKYTEKYIKEDNQEDELEERMDR